MDVGMSIASTLQEIYSRRPDLGMWDLFKSGMNVGKDMMGTMSNTLILAFAGGSLNTLVFIFAYNYSYHQIINMYSIGIELMQDFRKYGSNPYSSLYLTGRSLLYFRKSIEKVILAGGIIKR